MGRDRERDELRPVARPDHQVIPATPRTFHDPLGRRREELILDPGEIGVQARSSLLQGRGGEKDFRAELLRLQTVGQEIDKLPPAERLAERDNVLVQILSTSLGRQAYVSVSEGRFETWRPLEPELKEQLFQLAEARVSVFQGFVPWRVRSILTDDFTAGFDRDNRTLWFHRHKVFGDASEHQATVSLLHEQTHRLQWDAVQHPLRYPFLARELVEQWKHNFDNYVAPWDTPGSYDKYRQQPIEAFAYSRSYLLARRIYDL